MWDWAQVAGDDDMQRLLREKAEQFYSSDRYISAEVTDRADPKLAHLDGLNLSRAWMLERIARGLPAGDRRIRALRATGSQHRDASLGAVTSEHYVGSHWLGTFALYLESR